MTAAEEGVLLLCCRLGDPQAKPLTMPQFRELGRLVRSSLPPQEPLSELKVSHLTALGYEQDRAENVVGLLSRQNRLRDYLAQGEAMGIYPLTRLSEGYPHRLTQALGTSAPTVLFYRGDLTLLQTPAVAVIGSRQLLPENEVFAQEMGAYLARTGRVLVSGGAMGADRVAQNACCSHGGAAVIFTADRIPEHFTDPSVLYLSADGYAFPFSIPRAMNRNKFIHILGEKAVAIQCSYQTGGTWQGCTENLKHRWSEVYIFDDDSPASIALAEQGAIRITDPAHIDSRTQPQLSVF